MFKTKITTMYRGINKIHRNKIYDNNMREEMEIYY